MARAELAVPAGLDRLRSRVAVTAPSTGESGASWASATGSGGETQCFLPGATALLRGVLGKVLTHLESVHN